MDGRTEVTLATAHSNSIRCMLKVATFSALEPYVMTHKYQRKQDAQLSQRDRAAG